MKGADIMLREQNSLTHRECVVLNLLADGKRNREIAEVLGITENTVETHLKRIFRKIGVTNRVEAAKWYSISIDREGLTGIRDDK